jgi:hypothetical protein
VLSRARVSLRLRCTGCVYVYIMKNRYGTCVLRARATDVVCVVCARVCTYRFCFLVGALYILLNLILHIGLPHPGAAYGSELADRERVAAPLERAKLRAAMARRCPSRAGPVLNDKVTTRLHAGLNHSDSECSRGPR